MMRRSLLLRVAGPSGAPAREAEQTILRDATEGGAPEGSVGSSRLLGFGSRYKRARILGGTQRALTPIGMSM